MQNMAHHVEEIGEKRWSWWTHIISWPCVFGMYSTWTQTEWNHYWTVYTDVWITYFCCCNWKITRMGKAYRKDCCVVLRHGRTCSKNALRDTASWQTKNVEQLQKVSSPCLDEDSKSTSERVLCILGSRTFVSISWMGEEQTSVSHSSTESEIISLHSGLRMDGLPALDLDVVLRSTNNTAKQGGPAQGNLCGTGDHSTNKNKTKAPTERSTRDVEQLSNVEYPPTHILLKASLSGTFLKTTKLSSRWLSKDEVQQWDTFPEPTVLRLIGCSTESNWNQRSKSNLLTTKANLLTW